MIDHKDVIAGFVYGFGGLLIWTNVWRLYKDKQLKGVNWFPTIYFSLGGCYTIYFLLHLHARYAFIGSLISLLGNIAWVSLAIFYTRRKPEPIN